MEIVNKLLGLRFGNYGVLVTRNIAFLSQMRVCTCRDAKTVFSRMTNLLNSDAGYATLTGTQTTLGLEGDRNR
jgi:hypothetical protein